MNVTQQRYRPPQMRASDADRDAVVAALSEHFQAGRLTPEELEERTGHALTARTLTQLEELTADLPAPRPPGPTAPTAPAGSPHRPRYLTIVPLVVPLAALAIAALVLGTGVGIHRWAAWWAASVALLIARRLAGPRGIRRDFTRH